MAAGWYYADFYKGSLHRSAEAKNPAKDHIDPKTESMEAYLYLNSLRQKAGLGSFYGNEKLQAAAASHARYLAKNGADGHGESENKPGFSGADPTRRALAAGYASRLVTENLSSRNLDFKESVDGLFGAIYHRFAFLDPLMDEIGVAFAQDSGGRRIYVYDMGNYRLNGLCSGESFKGFGRYITGICADREKRVRYSEYKKALNSNIGSAPKIVVWPYNGQEDVPPAFYEEIPDPLPDFSVSGYPISVIFNLEDGRRVKVTSFRLYDEKKREVPVRVMDAKSDPNLHLKDNRFAIFPLKRLEYSTTYLAQLHYILDKKAKVKEWSFKTRSFDASMLKLLSNEDSFSIEPKRSYILYIEPHGPNDLIGELSYAEGVAVEMLDPHTFRIEVADAEDLPLTIRAGKREVRLLLAR